MTDTSSALPAQETLSRPPSPQRRYPAAPLVGVAAVVFDRAGRVLLVQRGREPSKGSWGLPGGLLELGERLVEGVRREVREETGLDVEVRDLLAAFEPILRDAEGRIEFHYVVIDYWAIAADGQGAANDDADALAWVDPRDADAIAVYALSSETAYVIRLGMQRHNDGASAEQPARAGAGGDPRSPAPPAAR